MERLLKLRKKIAIVGLAVAIVSTGSLLAYPQYDTITTEITKTAAVSKVDAETKAVAVSEQEEALESANKEIVNENGLNTYEECMVEANEKFMQYLEDNSTTYKFDDGTIVNLPDYDGVIEEAKQILKAQEQEC